MDRANKFKNILWIICGVGLAVAVTRFIFGLGATTNLTDNTPWGFWIGFDVMGGVALAGGGFVIAAFNYVFQKKEFQSTTRAAILTAFLGYIAVAVGLLFDLGLPWNIWHATIFWNIHSPLFEVAWCVMLYLTVLLLEFLPVILERFESVNIFLKLLKVLNKSKVPLVILGIMLSTLHQSSLGSLFLAMPYRLHPLWYTPILPVLFFVSAICLGLMMVMFENLFTHWIYNKKLNTEIASKLSKAAIIMLTIYGLTKFGDVIIRGAQSLMFELSIAGFLFWLEVIFGIILPLIIFIIPRNQSRPNYLFWGAFIGIVGIVVNRLNVGGLTHLNNLSDVGSFYFPSWLELTISASVVSAAFLAFLYFIENYKVWDSKPVDPADDVHVKPEFDSNRIYLGPSKSKNRYKFSFSFVIAFAIGFAFISGDSLVSKGIEDVNVIKARGNLDSLTIDGNRDGYNVVFKHNQHVSNGIKCGYCHHMNKPSDKATACYECHSKMYYSNDAFGHDWHTSSQGANLTCFQCHSKADHKSKSSAMLGDISCTSCHADIFPNDAKFIPKSYNANSYVDAMHILCINCHQKELDNSLSLFKEKPNLAKCTNCHSSELSDDKRKHLFGNKINKWVVVPSKLRTR